MRGSVIHNQSVIRSWLFLRCLAGVFWDMVFFLFGLYGTVVGV